jgi:hypothetical protein
MATKKIAERKKSQKAKEKLQKKTSERTNLVKERKEKRAASREEQETAPRGETIVNEVLVANTKSLDHLEKNYAVLQKLEEDYIKQQKLRVNLQEELEAQGFHTLAEKMDHLKGLASKKAEEISDMFKPLTDEDRKSINC